MNSATGKAIKRNFICGQWAKQALITRNDFKYKSLSCWALNTAVGCIHGCRFCYVPDTSTIKQGETLKGFGVEDPDLEWGSYVLVRSLNDKAFLSSLKVAEETPLQKLNSDGNRAVMLCTTTDPYQMLPDKELRKQHSELVTKALELILEKSTINVRILTRSPLAKQDFDLYKRFGNRLLFGMSIPTLDNKLARIYEPHAPAPSKRLETLREAKKAGLNIYVAVAPTYPECDENDLRNTISAIASLEPVTIFHEPINIRAENVARISEHAKSLGKELKTDVFATAASWRKYAIEQLHLVEKIATECRVQDRLHLWPDQGLISQDALIEVSNPLEHLKWVLKCHKRVSEWPGRTPTGGLNS